MTAWAFGCGQGACATVVRVSRPRFSRFGGRRRWQGVVAIFPLCHLHVVLYCLPKVYALIQVKCCWPISSLLNPRMGFIPKGLWASMIGFIDVGVTPSKHLDEASRWDAMGCFFGGALPTIASWADMIRPVGTGRGDFPLDSIASRPNGTFHYSPRSIRGFFSPRKSIASQRDVSSWVVLHSQVIDFVSKAHALIRWVCCWRISPYFSRRDFWQTVYTGRHDNLNWGSVLADTCRAH